MVKLVVYNNDQQSNCSAAMFEVSIDLRDRALPRIKNRNSGRMLITLVVDIQYVSGSIRGSRELGGRLNLQTKSMTDG